MIFDDGDSGEKDLNRKNDQQAICFAVEVWQWKLSDENWTMEIEQRKLDGENWVTEFWQSGFKQKQWSTNHWFWFDCENDLALLKQY